MVPSDVSSLRCWLDFGDSSSLYTDSSRTTPVSANDDPIGGATDKSGNSNHGTQATSGRRPKYKTSTLNGLSVADFDGSDDFLGLPSFASFTAGEMFVVVKIDADPPASATVTGCWKFGSATVGGPNSHYPFTDGIIYEEFGTTARKTVGNPTPSLSSTYRVYNIVTVSGEFTVFLDSSQIFTTATNTVGFYGTPTIGCSYDGPTSGTPRMLDGQIAEFLFFNAKLGSSDKSGMQSYLNNRWFVSGSANLLHSTLIHSPRLHSRLLGG